MIDAHYWPTPNGWKLSIALEEMELEYRVIPVNIGRGDQFNEDYLKISPNNRMPAIIDHDPADGGDPISVFESGAILLYLAETPIVMATQYPICKLVLEVSTQVYSIGSMILPLPTMLAVDLYLILLLLLELKPIMLSIHSTVV